MQSFIGLAYCTNAENTPANTVTSNTIINPVTSDNSANTVDEVTKEADDVTQKHIKGEIIKISGNTYKITNLNNPEVSIIGKNVRTIGDKAFFKCKNLKKVVIRSKSLKSKGIGRKAFKGIPAKVKI